MTQARARQPGLWQLVERSGVLYGMRMCFTYDEDAKGNGGFNWLTSTDTDWLVHLSIYQHENNMKDTQNSHTLLLELKYGGRVRCRCAITDTRR